MPIVPLAPGAQVRPTVAPLPDGARVAAPNLVVGDFTMRNPAPLKAHDRTTPLVDPFHSSYNIVQPLTADTEAEGDLAFGRQISGATAQIADITNSVQMQANALLTDNAVNKAKEAALRLAYDKDTGFTSLKGYDALNRPDGKPLADEYAGKFDEQAKALSGDLKNDAQRKAFAEQALGIRTSLYGQATQHETQEFRTYNLSTQDGTIKTETDNIGLNYRDPDAVNNSVERIKGAVAEQGMATGKSVTWIEAAQKDAVSKAHSMALTSAMEDGNVVFADAYMKAHKADMNADDVLRVRGSITKEMDGRMGLAAARDALTNLTPGFAPTDLDRVHGIVANLESRNNEANPDGTRKTSAKGAVGVMQVMPKTAKDPGFGVKPSNGTPEDDARMGRDYMDAMVTRYSGDLPLAFAAYNWGPGNLDSAVKEAKATGKDWLAMAPQETRDYVKGGLAQYAAGGGRPATPTLEDALARIDNDPRVNTSPARLDFARREVTARFEAMVKAKKSGEDDAMATALHQVEANGGNYMGLPVSVRSAIPADKIDTVMNFADKVRGGNTVTNLAVYQHLTDDKALKGLTDSQFYAMRPELSHPDFQHFAEQRAKLLDPKANGQGPGDLNTPALRMALDNRLHTLNIDPNPKKGDNVAMARVGAINKFATEQVFLAQQQHGKKFTDAETTAFVDTLFSKSIPFRDTVLGIPTGGLTNKRMLEMTPNDIPSESVQAIKDAFKKRGISNPTDGDVLSAYWRTKTLAGR